MLRINQLLKKSLSINMFKHCSLFLVCFIFLLEPTLGQYKGTGSVTQGKATDVLVSNLYTCTGGRVAGLANIKSTDGLTWKVPADVNFTNTAFPFSSDLHNSCIGVNNTTSSQALSNLNGSDIITIDNNGEVITAFVFADNYFEMYINGVAVGKDKVPFTQFNSSIVRFKVNRPFTIAMKLVDWEENLGVGSENNNGFAYHPGDGGMVAVFMDANKKIIATTNDKWRTQTFYTSPIKDLSCPVESGKYRLSSNCDMTDVNDGSKFYGLHWPTPNGWETQSFVDTIWPFAKVYTNSEIGVNNKPAYTNFVDVFDNASQDAQFIWSSNVILDNLVLTRFTVPALTTKVGQLKELQNWNPSPNPVNEILNLNLEMVKNDHPIIRLKDSKMAKLMTLNNNQDFISLEGYPAGVYFLEVSCLNTTEFRKIIKN